MGHVRPSQKVRNTDILVLNVTGFGVRLISRFLVAARLLMSQCHIFSGSEERAVLRGRFVPGGFVVEVRSSREVLMDGQLASFRDFPLNFNEVVLFIDQVLLRRMRRAHFR